MTIYHKTSQGWLKLFCNSIDFGRYPLDMPCTSFYVLLNSAVIDLIRTIPRSAQLPVMMFSLYYAGLKPGDKLDFFHNYYSPIWSIIPHILKKQENTLFSEILINHAAGTHAMAMLLHSPPENPWDYTPLTFYLTSCRPMNIVMWLVKTRRSVQHVPMWTPAVKPACSAPQNPSGT